MTQTKVVALREGHPTWNCSKWPSSRLFQGQSTF